MLALLLVGLLGINSLSGNTAFPLAPASPTSSNILDIPSHKALGTGEVHAGPQADQLPHRQSGVDGRATLVGRSGGGGHRNRTRHRSGGSVIRRGGESGDASP
ncbi:hypothetical protein NL676_019182 [Syzygium grande]|nr:hypothetical protein NL676_019182 [Syzygium grande]